MKWMILIVMLSLAVSACIEETNVCREHGAHVLCTHSLELCNRLYNDTCVHAEVNTIEPTALQTTYSDAEIHGMERPRDMRLRIPRVAIANEPFIIEARNAFEAMKGVTISIYLDGVLVQKITTNGRTEFTFDMPGTYELVAERSGYHLTRTRIVVESKHKTEIALPVEQEPTEQNATRIIETINASRATGMYVVQSIDMALSPFFAFLILACLCFAFYRGYRYLIVH